jgi:hypothetical protein
MCHNGKDRHPTTRRSLDSAAAMSLLESHPAVRMAIAGADTVATHSVTYCSSSHDTCVLVAQDGVVSILIAMAQVMFLVLVKARE